MTPGQAVPIIGVATQPTEGQLDAHDIERIRDLERRVDALERRQGEDFSSSIGLSLAYIRPIIAVIAAGLRAGTLSAEDAIRRLSPVDESDPSSVSENGRDQRLIESWAGLRPADE